MRIFAGFGYHDRDKWVKEMVFPMIEAFGAEVLSGEEIYGQRLSEGVKRKIAHADALIGFLTRRGDPADAGIWDTHRWVTDELAVAMKARLRLLVLEVREKGVSDQGGILGDRQRIEYDEVTPDRCPIELVKAIGGWHEGACNRGTFGLTRVRWTLSRPGLLEAAGSRTQ